MTDFNDDFDPDELADAMANERDGDGPEGFAPLRQRSGSPAPVFVPIALEESEAVATLGALRTIFESARVARALHDAQVKPVASAMVKVARAIEDRRAQGSAGQKGQPQ